MSTSAALAYARWQAHTLNGRCFQSSIRKVRTIAPRRSKRVTFNADAELLAEAQAALGTGCTTETLNTALAEVARRARLESLARRGFPDLTPEVLDEIRRGRTSRW